ncbi:MAG: exodeoxyribonuclease III [Chloroflexi bacterium OHK40]
MAPTRIISWNVNGIRAGERKGFLRWLEGCGAEIVALQEVKAAPEQLSPALREACGYQACWLPAERAGYSGVATLSRTACPETVRGLGDPRFDVEGRVLISRFPAFTLFNVYVPSGTMGPARVAHKLAFTARLCEAVRAELARGRSLVLVGDLNTAHEEIDLARPRENRNTSGFMPEERAALSALLGVGLVDSFRHLHPGVAAYSWWTMRGGARERNVGWRLDYILVSTDLAPRLLAADIHPEVSGSDHCPVSATLDL